MLFYTSQGRVAKMEFTHKLLLNLFPPRCLFCQNMVDEAVIDRPVLNKNVDICIDCYQALPHNSHCCVRCALPLAEDVSSRVLCGRCIRKMPVFDYAYSLFRYEAEIIGLVHQLKFSEKICHARSIGEMLRAKFEQELLPEHGRPDCLLPVSLHKSRLRQRGFNQSIEIARVIEKEFKIPIDHDTVIRQRSTESQTGLDAQQRRKNIRGAFSMVTEASYDHVLIIDDVITTGSTVNELARVLKKANVERVGVLSIARAPVKN